MPGSVAVMVEVLTDNRNRTGAEVRNIFTKNGGSTSEPGAVAWQFERKGQIVVPVGRRGGADAHRPRRRGRRHRRRRRQLAGHDPPTELHVVRTAPDAAGIAVDSSDLTMIPTSTIALDTAESAKKVLRLIDALDDHDDVQAVHANFDIPDTILEPVEAG